MKSITLLMLAGCFLANCSTSVQNSRIKLVYEKHIPYCDTAFHTCHDEFWLNCTNSSNDTIPIWVGNRKASPFSFIMNQERKMCFFFRDMGYRLRIDSSYIPGNDSFYIPPHSTHILLFTCETMSFHQDRSDTTAFNAIFYQDSIAIKKGDSLFIQ